MPVNRASADETSRLRRKPLKELVPPSHRHPGKMKPTLSPARHHVILKEVLQLAALLTLTACNTAHNPFIIRDTVSASTQSSTAYSGHQRKVFVTEQALPASEKYEVVEQIEVGKIWYGESKSVVQAMADRARQIGADAVVEAKTWRQPSGFSWSAPHGSGKAIKLLQSSTNALAALRGDWY